MSDIDLYSKTPGTYDELQNKRPDYVGAEKAFVDLAVKHLNGKTSIAVADFCCGIGKDTMILAERLEIGEATLIDINKDFLQMALASGIKAKKVEIVESDILDAKIESGHDLVISMFAYHHVPDEEKNRFVAKAKDALKTGGIVILGEIFSPDRETTLAYYEHLIRCIPGSENDQALQTFLRQTAKSDDFEYKVSRDFAHSQFVGSGLKLLESIKIWPTDGSFREDVGTFVEVWGV